MSTQLIPFNAGGLPAHIASAFTAEDANTQGRPTIDQLSYRGKVWRRVVKGEEIVLTRADQETGEIVPVQMVSMVVLDLNKARSRSYYEGAYEDGKNQAPICYSADGVTPDESVKDKQSPTCASCQWSVKGSKITESNKQTTACSPFKRIAVVPVSHIADHPPLLLRMAQTSVWDKDTEKGTDGWYAWDQYVDMLRARGVNHTAAVETRIKFDMGVPYPKLLFSATRWLSPEEVAAVRARLDDAATKAVIKDILTGGNRDGLMGQTAPDAKRPTGQMQETKLPNGHTPPPAVDLAGLMPSADPTADATTVAKAETQANAAVVAEAKLPPKVPKAPKAPAAAAPAWPPEGWTVHPDDPNYFYKDDLVMGEEELRAHVAPPPPPPAPAAPAVPKAPKTPAKPKVEKVKAEPVDDDGFGAVKQAPAAAATPVKDTPVVSGTPSDLSTLLEGWDDN